MYKFKKAGMTLAFVSMCMAGEFSSQAFAASTHSAAPVVLTTKLSPPSTRSPTPVLSTKSSLPSAGQNVVGNSTGFRHHRIKFSLHHACTGKHSAGSGHHHGCSNQQPHAEGSAKVRFVNYYLKIYKENYKIARSQAHHDDENGNFQADTNTINTDCKGWAACLAKYAIDLSGDLKKNITASQLTKDPAYSSLYTLLAAAYNLREAGVELPNID